MDNNTTPAAAVPATDATPNTNSNPAPAEPAQSPAEPQSPATPQANVPADQVEAFNKFVEANGGFDKAFGKMKQTISNPQPQQPEQPQAPAQPTQPTDTQLQSQAPLQQQKPADGYLTANDIAKLQYNKMLSEAYSELDTEGYITKGEFVKEATSMGIPVMDQAGNMNDAAIRKFLDLKKATIPPAPASAPITTTPTVTYTTVEGDITTQEQADKIMSEGMNNPQYQDALKFTRERIFGKATKPKQKLNDIIRL